MQGGNAILLRGGTDYALLNSLVVGPQACLDIDATGGTTVRAADNALQDLGAPVFRSVSLSCPTPFRDDGNVTVAEIQAIFGSGTNGNSSNFTSTLVNLFVNGAGENAAPATDPTPFNNDPFAVVNAAAPNRLESVAYVGAVRNASDSWFAGWTCNAGYANFGSGSGNCTAIPTS